jgi:hypothetical protein
VSVYNRSEEKKSVCDVPDKKNNQAKNNVGSKNPLAGIDKDMLLTAAVLLLMMKNGGDMRLILALGYIIIGGELKK